MNLATLGLRNLSCFRGTLREYRLLVGSRLLSVGAPEEGSSRNRHEVDAPLDLPDPLDPLANPLAKLGEAEMSADQVYWRKRAASVPPKVYERTVDEEGRAFAIGRRKRSIAKVWLQAGEGGVIVNGRNYVELFPRVDHRDQILRPLIITRNLDKCSIEARVVGGGQTGQAEALRHGIAKAMQNFNPSLRPELKQEGLLTRDSRVVECKKYGRKKARKSFQWVKR